MPQSSLTRMNREDYKHFYRFVYLKSEHWQNLRIAKLAAVDAKCNICEKRDLSNDVHHVVYRKLYDVKLEDLVILCRGCHEKVHSVLEEFLFIKKVEDVDKRWKKTLQKLKFGNEIREECLDGFRAAITAKRLYKEAAMMSKFKFPKIRKGRILIDFFKANPYAKQDEWEDLAKSQLLTTFQTI